MVDGAVQPVSGLRRKAVLATLALHAGEIVSTDRLADIVWGDAAASTALNTLQSHVSHLRTVLGSKAAILAKPPGYVLEVGDEGTDVRLAERLLGQATTRPGDPVRSARELREALALWRGRPLADVTGVAWLEQPVQSPPLAAPVPAQLPAAVAAFAGRDAELASLDAILPGAAAAHTVVSSAISGTAGVGKTALALHWAHRVRERFPDGQLYVNLRGFDPGEPPMDPDQALRGFIAAFGVPPERVPDGLEAKAGLYRSLLNGKRVLVVLDNARDTEQVRPLLPGSPGCLALVTSRNQLTSLIAAEGAYPLSLGLLTVPEAHDLLARRLGVRRVATQPQATAEIIQSCARLPLALTIAAARAAAKPGFPLAAIAAELRESAALLDPFDGGELAAAVRAVFACSYRALSTPAARVFRLLGLHPGRVITVAAAASLTAVPARTAVRLLAELARAHLLIEYGSGRYAFHDLLRAYAAEQARTHDAPDVRDDAVGRVIDHFLQTAYAGAKPGGPGARTGQLKRGHGRRFQRRSSGTSAARATVWGSGAPVAEPLSPANAWKGRLSPSSPAAFPGACSHSTQGEVVSRAAFAGRPGAEVPPVGFGDRHVVDTGLTAAHQPVVIELP